MLLALAGKDEKNFHLDHSKLLAGELDQEIVKLARNCTAIMDLGSVEYHRCFGIYFSEPKFTSFVWNPTVLTDQKSI
jgi:hypothetical protein